MVDVKKFAARFIVLATIASLIGLSLSGTFTAPHNLLANRSTKTIASVPDNAFIASVEDTPLALRPNLAGASSNLTVAAAQKLADVVLALNPQGPGVYNGKKGFVLPDPAIMTGYLTMELPSFKISDLWVDPASETVTPAASNDAAANQEYVRSVQSVMKQTLGSPDLISAINQAADGSSANNVNGALVAALGDASRGLKNVAVPDSFADFHKKLLVYLEDQRNVLAALAMGGADPFKSIIVLSGSDKVDERASADLLAMNDAYRSLDLPTLLSDKSPASNIVSSVGSTVSNVLGLFKVPTAYAISLSGLNPTNQCGSGFSSTLSGLLSTLVSIFNLTKVPVGDSSDQKNNSGALSALLFQCQSKILAQQNKNSMVSLMNSAVLTQVQNNGDPSFVTNNQVYAGDAGIRGADRARKEIANQTCPEFQTPIDNTVFSMDNVVGPPNDTVNGNPDIYADTITNDGTFSDGAGGTGLGSTVVNGVPTGCTIKQAATSDYFNDFADDPNNWDTYFLSLDDSNNLNGTLIAAHDSVLEESSNAADAADVSAQANGNMKNDVECVDWTIDATGEAVCDQFQTITPGAVLGDALNKAVDSQYDDVVSSEDPTEMDQEVADGLTTQLLSRRDLGLYNLAFTTQNDLASICQKTFGIPGVANNPTFNKPIQLCNTTIGKIVNQFSKYVNLIQQIGSLIGQFF